MQRLSILRRRLLESEGLDLALTIRALSEAIDNLMPGMKVGDSMPDVIGGRVVPAEWRPASFEEGHACHKAVLALLRDAALHESDPIRRAGQDLIVQKTESLLEIQELALLRDTFGRRQPDLEVLPRLLQALSTFLYQEQEYAKEEKRLPEGYLSQVRDWMHELTPCNLHGRVVAAVGKDAYFHTQAFRGEEHALGLTELAKELRSDPMALTAELPWLLSSDAKSAEALGAELGKLDTDASLLGTIYSESAKAGSAPLANGYWIVLICFV
jgi:hypothetical protein